MFLQAPLPYSYDCLEPIISSEIMELHYSKHHAGYVKNLNNALTQYSLEYSDSNVEQLMKDLPSLPPDIYQSVRNNLGGHLNHTLFWQLMTSQQTKFSKELSEQIKKDFGSEEEFWDKFIKSATTLFGSGWVWLSWDPITTSLVINQYPNQETPIFDGLNPLLGVDVWEHAYYLDYKNDRGKYVAEWKKIANKQYASELF